jgi:putative DNA primase/helicase
VPLWAACAVALQIPGEAVPHGPAAIVPGMADDDGAGVSSGAGAAERGETMTTPTQPLFDAALTYAARGWAVFPCHTPTPKGCSCRKNCGRIGKHPRTQHGLKDATTDEATIQRWWRQFPQANIGIATGAVSGLVVLDEDSYKGGDQSRLDLEQSYSPLPETVQQLTGGGGVQYFFAHPGVPVKNGVETLGHGLDIRGDGGYVIAPPSLHMSGKRYVWEMLHDPDEVPLAAIPAWLLALCQDAAGGSRLAAGAPIPQGQRNNVLFRLGCSLRARGCTNAVILAALREMNATQCQPPLPEEEVATITASCAKYEPGQWHEEAHQWRDGNGAPPPQDPDAPARRAGSAAGSLPYSDYTNALAFVLEHGHLVRYCYPWKAWLVWTGTHWERDMSGRVMRLAKQTVKRLARHAEALDDAEAKALMAHVKSSLSTVKLKALIECAQSEPGIAVQPEDLDTHRWLLNCRNGTLDLRTKTLRAHDRADLLTFVLPVDYDALATCPTWETFLTRIMAGNTALIAFLQRAVGYALTGVIREHVLLILWGTGRNGKSTFLNALRTLLAAYAMKAPSELLMVSANDRHPTERADLCGKRFVAAIETEQGRRLAEVFVKEATGGDPIRARRMREDFWEFQPTHKVFLATNHKPIIGGTDHAIWERIRLVPFTVTIPPEEIDTTLPAQLELELPGILAWALRGCTMWQEQGLGVPDEVKEATAGYRSEMDVLGQFLDECCVLGPNYRTKASDLYACYKTWCEQQGVGYETQRAWGLRLSERGIERFTNNGTWYRGLGLLAPPPDERHVRKERKETEGENGINGLENSLRGENRNPGSVPSVPSADGLATTTQTSCRWCAAVQPVAEHRLADGSVLIRCAGCTKVLDVRGAD